jgi:hypothetical protein
MIDKTMVKRERTNTQTEQYVENLRPPTPPKTWEEFMCSGRV